MKFVYAVLYRKEIFDEEQKIYFCKPYKIIKGIKDDEDQCFLDEENNINYYMTSLELLSDSIKFCVGTPVAKEELVKIFPTAKTMEEREKLLLDDAKKNILICFYHQNRIQIGKIPIKEMLELNDENKDIEKIEEEYEEYEKYLKYEELKKEYTDGLDFTLLLKQNIEEILNSKTIEDYKKIIATLKEEKVQYAERIENNNSSLIIMIPDQFLDSYLAEQNLKAAKERIKVLTQKSEKVLQDKTSVNNQQVATTMLQFYENTYLEIISQTSLTKVKKKISLNIKVFEDIINLLDDKDLTEDEKTTCERESSKQIRRLKDLSTKENLKELQKEYKLLYETTIEKVEEISKILENNGFSLEVYDEKIEAPKEEKRKEEEDIKENLEFDYLKVYQYLTSKIIDRNKQISSILTVIDMIDNNPNKDKRMSCLIAGTTGTGKTQTFKELKRILPNRPMVLTDTNQITEHGYIGGTIEENILAPLLKNAHTINNKKENQGEKITKKDILLAQHGIVFLDEIDKRKKSYESSRDINGEGVINELLKLMDGTDYEVKVGSQLVGINTSDLVIFSGGAFEEYFEQADKTLGFNKVAEQEEFAKFYEVNPEKLVEYGLSSQFIGRCTSIVLYPPHTKESLMKLEKNKPTSNLENKRLLFEREKINLVWEEDFIENLIQDALELKTGGRGIGNILARCTDKAYDEIKKYPDTYKTVFLPTSSIKNPENVILINKDRSFTLVSDILKREKQESEKTYHENEIKLNEEALKEALSYKYALTSPSTTELRVIEEYQKVYIKDIRKVEIPK